MESIDDFYANPLAYPGPPAGEPGVLIDGVFHPTNTPDLTGRTPVLAVGSNASTGQIERKLAALPSPHVVPFQLVSAHNLAVGVSAHVSRPGYVPATPIEAPGELSRLVVIWLDSRQLPAIDETEPNYDRVPVPTERFPLIPDGQTTPMPACDAYASRHGHLADDGALARRLTSQPALIASLLQASSALREMAGETPEQFIASMQSPDLRARAGELFHKEGWVRMAQGLAG